MSNPRSCDRVIVARKPTLLASPFFPRIVAAIRQNDGRKHVPVFIMMGKWACLRWIAARTEHGLRPPDDVSEAMFDLDEAEAAAPEESAEHVASPPPTARAPKELWDVIMAAGAHTIVDSYLVSMNAQDLGREVEAAGFDPNVERELGPGLRDSVVHAIGKRCFELENPPDTNAGPGPR